MRKEQNTAKRIGLSAAAGLLLALSLPPYRMPFLLPLGVACLALALRGASFRIGAYAGFVCGLLHSLPTLFWMGNLFGAGFVPLCAILSVFPAIFGAIWPGVEAKLARLQHGAWLAPPAFATLWVAAEFVRAELFLLNFGWTTLGYSVADRPAFAPLASVLGVYGVSFAAVALGASSPRGLRAAIFALVPWILACLPWLVSPTTPENPLTVRLVQADSDDDRELVSRSKILPGETHPDLILWPEYALQSDPNVPNRLTKIAPIVSFATIARKTGAVLVFGAKDFRGQPDDGPYFNTAFVLGPGGALLGTHVKNHVVHLVRDGIPGRDARAIETPLGKLGVSICFDNDYPDVDRRLVQGGAVLLVVPNMDPDEWGRVQQAQHALLFQMRAMETGRWLVRADVAGGTSAVAPNGVTIARAKSADPETITATVGRTDRRTLYVRFGWLLAPLCLIASIAMTLLAALERRRSSPPL